MVTLKVGPENYPALGAIAASLRRRSGQVKPRYSTRQIIESCFPGTIVTGRTLPAVCHESVSVDEAAFRSHRAPHVIVYQRALSGPEQRYAIAHAVAHIIFDGKRGCDTHDAARELRCDRFADELLAPIEELNRFIKVWPSRDLQANETYLDQVDQIASHFVLPASVIDQRIQSLHRFCQRSRESFTK
jgi:IrrE N-terminal-like domain